MMEMIILILLFLILLGMGVPIVWSIGISSIGTMLFSIPAMPALSTVAQRLATGVDSFALLAIPFFILAGQIMNQGGIAKRLIAFARALVGSLPGGLAHVNIFAAMLFGAIAGSAVAAASAIGSFMTDEMEKEGYDRPFSAAINITSSTTGLVIPPSNILIVYSLASGGVSIGALFIAGYIPGIIVAIGLMVVALIWAKKKNYPRGERVRLSVVAVTFIQAVPSLFLLILVIGGIVAGIFTATEASAVAVLYCVVLAWAYGSLNRSAIREILLSSVITTAIVMFLIGTSMSMSWIMAYEEIPQAISDGLIGISENPIVILLLINLALLIVGVFMDMTPAVLIFTPIFLPLVQELGMDPIHFGIVMVLNLCIGICTPPVGSLLFVGVTVADTSIQKVVRPLLPLFGVMLITLLMVTFIPELSLFIPRIFGF